MTLQGLVSHHSLVTVALIKKKKKNFQFEHVIHELN